MSNLILLYDLRNTAGQRRQRRHASALRGLTAIIRRAGKQHSYGGYDRALNSQLMRRTSYNGGSRGYVRRLHGDDFIYRLAGIKELANDKTISWVSHVKAAQPPHDLFRLVNEAYKLSGDWIPLRRYALGELSGYRDITFWTTHEIVPSNVVADAHLMGLTNNWLKQWSVIIRCKVKDLATTNSTRVPTVLDAFTELIFYPTHDTPKPSSGSTISLSATGPLTPGVMEFVLNPIRVENLQIKPCFISNKSLPCVHSKDVDLWNSLDAFYRPL